MQDRAFLTINESPSETAFATRIQAAWPADGWRDVNVAVAVSGGADSVAMLRALAGMKRLSGGRGSLCLIHYDHRVRGEASAEDAAWVERLAASLGLQCLVERSPAAGSRSEQALRHERRAFYGAAADRLGARYVATGHTADDQAETVLFRAARGSGLRGLAGVRPFAPLSERCTLARPLLGASRSEVLGYLAEIGQDHREDASNATDAYRRNWLRRRVMPLLEEACPGAAESLAGLAEQAAEASSLVETLAGELLDAALVGPPTDSAVRLDAAALATRPRGLVVEALRLAWRRAGWPEQAMTAPHWRRLGDWASATPPAAPETFPGAVRAERCGERLTLARDLGPFGVST